MPNFEGKPNVAGEPTSTSRRENIIKLVEMLLEQGGVQDIGISQQSTFEDDKDIPTVEERLQIAGADALKSFQNKINNLDKELRYLSNAARTLGSSAAILSSTFDLRTRIAHISYLYSLNASDLFPRKILSPAAAHALSNVDEINTTPKYRPKPRRKRRLFGKHRALPHAARPVVDMAIELEDFPNQFEALAQEITTFVNRLNGFPEFTDEAVNASISSFAADLKYWSSCLHSYEGQFRYPAVQRYVQDLTIEMGEHIDNVTSTLSMFVEVGIPTIRLSQKNSAGDNLNLSGVAAFFSGVTATTLQFSYQLRSPTANAVNLFWFLSLVFSIAATINSLLGSIWETAMYRPPRHRVPWWVFFWFKHFPQIFLVLSALCFSVGLCLFAYASGQSRIVAAATTVSAGFVAFGVAAVSVWSTFERRAFIHHQGTKWLADVLAERRKNLLNLPGIVFVKQGLGLSSRWASAIWSSAGTKLRRVRSIAKSIISSDGKKSSDMENCIPMTLPPDEGDIASSGTSRCPLSETGPSSPLDSPPMSSTPMEFGSIPNTPSSPTTPSTGRKLWKNALRTVKMSSVLSHPTATSSTTLPTDRKRMLTEPPVKAIVQSRVAALVTKLKCLEPTQDLAAHQALVKHLQFSPNGKFLVTSSWDRTSVIFRVEDSVVSHHRTLAHAQGFVSQVAWSPSGHLLLTKLNRGVKVWTQHGVCQQTIDRPTYVESITWFPGGKAFLSVEGSNVVRVDLKGNVLETYNFGSIKLQDVTVTPDGTRLLGVGPLLQSPNGLSPSKSRAEKRLAVFNMDIGQVEHVIPMLNDVKGISLADTRNGLVALVSYENKAPPQLWKLEIVHDIARLTLQHTYMPRSPVDFAGPSYFGGKNGEMVFCAGKAGDIHIWDQESGSILHHIRAQDLAGDLTCIAWNHAEDNPFMFAIGSHDGALRIWTKLPSERQPSTSAQETSIPFAESSSPEDTDNIQSSDAI